MGAITDVAGIRVGHHHKIDSDANLGSGGPLEQLSF